jgi:hypothetical protein
MICSRRWPVLRLGGLVLLIDSLLSFQSMEL